MRPRPCTEIGSEEPTVASGSWQHFEMGNVELIELKKSSLDSLPIMPTLRVRGTFIRRCGKLMWPSQDVMNQIQEAFEILKAPYYRTSMIVTRGSRCGPNPWQQHHHKARDALRSATKGERAVQLLQSVTGGKNDEIYMKSQLAHCWSDAWVRYLDHIVHFNIYHNAPQPQRERYVNLLHLRSVDENKQAGLVAKTRVPVSEKGSVKSTQIKKRRTSS